MELLEYLISLYVPHEGVVLDSFAGSGTTGHAVLNLNRRDKGKRHFILVELGDYAKNLTAARVEGAIRSDHELPGGERESFTYYELGAPLLVDGELNPDVPVERVREYVWFTETQQPFVEPEVEGHPYFLGTANRAAYHFIFEPDHVGARVCGWSDARSGVGLPGGVRGCVCTLGGRACSVVYHVQEDSSRHHAVVDRRVTPWN